MNKRSLENKLYNNRYSAFRQYGFTENETQQILNNQAIVDKIKQGLDDMSIFERAIKDKYQDSSYVPLESVVKGLREILNDTLHSKSFGGKNHD